MGTRSRVGLASAILAGLALASTANALTSTANALPSAQIVSVINAEREANGLPSLREDPALSAGCGAYDAYRHLNGSVQDGFTPGPEEASKPGYTAPGARASHDSLLNAGDRAADDWVNGDAFDDAPGHLFQLMNPDLAREPGHRLVYSTTVPFSTTIFGH